MHVHSSTLQSSLECDWCVQVRDWIAQMKQEGLAFFTGNFYLLAGVLLQKKRSDQPADADMTDGLLSLMTALK